MTPARNITPAVAAFTVNGASSHTVTFGGIATVVVMSNLSSGDITVQINGLSSAQFTLVGNSATVFRDEELQITSLVFVNSASGASPVNIEVIYGLGV